LLESPGHEYAARLVEHLRLDARKRNQRGDLVLQGTGDKLKLLVHDDEDPRSNPSDSPVELGLDDCADDFDFLTCHYAQQDDGRVAGNTNKLQRPFCSAPIIEQYGQSGRGARDRQ